MLDQPPPAGYSNWTAPLLSRIGKFRVDWIAARELLGWACAGLVADIVLKALLEVECPL